MKPIAENVHGMSVSIWKTFSFCNGRQLITVSESGDNSEQVEHL